MTCLMQTEIQTEIQTKIRLAKRVWLACRASSHSYLYIRIGMPRTRRLDVCQGGAPTHRHHGIRSPFPASVIYCTRLSPCCRCPVYPDMARWTRRVSQSIVSIIMQAEREWALMALLIDGSTGAPLASFSASLSAFPRFGRRMVPGWWSEQNPPTNIPTSAPEFLLACTTYEHTLWALFLHFVVGIAMPADLDFSLFCAVTVKDKQ